MNSPTPGRVCKSVGIDSCRKRRAKNNKPKPTNISPPRFVYSIGGAILDKDEPSKVLYRCGNFLLTPEKWYEERGFVPNVCFPCATLQDADTGRIALYYGCADSYVGLAFTTVDEVVDYIKTHDNAGPTDHEVGIR